VNLLPALAAVAGILLVASEAGWLAARALGLDRPALAAERLVWGVALGLLLLAGVVPACFAVGLPPGWIPFLAGAAGLALLGRAFSARGGETPEATGSRPPEAPRARPVSVFLGALLVLGVGVYALRCLTEPMWATDFLAIWGGKGKAIFGAGGLPAWLHRMPELGFTHPEYPLGLPFLYASFAFLLGYWDDHATALLFPVFQWATLLFLAAWLRRHGAPRPVPLAAAAALSLVEPLYRAFTTGMGEVPLSFFLLLLGASLVDALDREPGAVRRLTVAALGAAALKNEGLLAAAAAAVIALAARRTAKAVRWRAAAAALVPALSVRALQRLRMGPLPLRDFDFRLLLAPELPIRIGFDLRAIALETLGPGAFGLLLLAILFGAGRRSIPAVRLATLAAILLSAYAILPAFAVLGPDWLVRTAFVRTSVSLAPLAAAAVVLRLAPLFAESVSGDGSSGSG
jgi:hypothetical protein